MYSTRQPQDRIHPPHRTNNPPKTSRTHFTAAEALFQKQHHRRPSAEETKSKLRLPLPGSPKAALPVAPAPVEPILTPKQKQHMRTLYHYGMTARELAEYFRVSLKTVAAALVGFPRKRE